jgi:hypothetical protein
LGKERENDNAESSEEESQAGASPGEDEACGCQAFGQRPSQERQAHQHRPEDQEPPSQGRLKLSGTDFLRSAGLPHKIGARPKGFVGVDRASNAAAQRARNVAPEVEIRDL